MATLRELAGAHSPLVLIDAASSRIQAGVWERGEPRWAASDEEAGIGIFRCLETLGVRPEAAAAFAFCSGPGSILGIRTSAMALRIWRADRAIPVYGYASLAVVAHAHPDFGGAVIADARRGAWHAYRRPTGLSREPAEALSGDLIVPEGFRHWAPLPPGTRTTPYDLSRLLPLAGNSDLFSVVSDPDAVLAAEPAYALWTPAPHRA